jgi:[acyl-carrier-protein] S-malonyltransferase
MCKLGLVFPGQGAQYVGMGSDLHREYAEVRDVFRRAQEVLGVDVAALCFEGPQETLDLTVNTQIAILTLEMAIFTVFEPQLPLAPSVLGATAWGSTVPCMRPEPSISPTSSPLSEPGPTTTRMPSLSERGLWRP